MNFLKKARGQVKVAVKEVRDVAQQGQERWDSMHQNTNQQYPPPPQQHQQQHQQQHYQQPQQSQQAQQHEQQYYAPPPSQGYHQQQQPQQQYYTPPPPQGEYQQQQHHQGYYNASPPAQYNQQPAQPSQEYSSPPPTQYSAPPPPASQAHHAPYTPAQAPQVYEGPYVPEQQPAQAPNYQSPEVEHPRNISVANSGPKCLAPESAWLETVPFYVLQPNVRSQLGDLLAEELSFTICKTCYASQIAPHSNLAANFIPLQTPPPESSSMNLLVYKEAYCNGSIPRNRQVLYQCASQNSLRPLSDWAQQKAALPGCNGSDVSFEQGRWEASKAGDTAMCGTCYELFVRGTPFERHFSFTAGSHNPDYNWQCDVGRDGIISRVLVQEVLSPSPDYKRWSSITKTWCELPRCPGDGVALKESGSSLAYVAQDGNIGIFCRGCYQDHMAGTVFEGIAKEVELTEEQLTTIPCNLGGAHAKFAMKRAIKRGDFKIWSNSASLNGKVPKCVGLIGVGEAELRTAQEFSWYKLRDHPSIEVCPSCYHICLELFGLDHLFDPIDRPLIGGRVRQCFMPLVVEDANTSLDEPYDFASTLAWRGKMLRDGVAYYYDTDGDLSIFNGYAERVASMPPPCFANSRSSLSPNERKWFGRGANRDDPNDFNFSMCEECFTNCVKGTSIENMVNGDATVAVNKLPGGFVCNAYSNRSRKILKEAAAAGNWEHFAQHWRKREEIRTRFLAAKQREAVQLKKALLLQAQVEAEGARLQINLMQSLTANTNATIMGIGGSVAEAAAPDYGQRYGNSSVGYGYLTHNGASAAMNQQQAIQFASQMQVKDVQLWANSGDTMTDSFVIAAIVDEVTKEWRGVE